MVPWLPLPISLGNYMEIHDVGFIGLGKMGLPIAKNLIEANYKLHAYDTSPEALKQIQQQGGLVCNSIAHLLEKLPAPQIIFLCIPVGKNIDEAILQMKTSLAPGSVLIDLGNSFYQDSRRRSLELHENGIHFVDVGMSGGVQGAQDGACLMIGGNKDIVTQLDPLLSTIAAPDSYRYMGESGAGHLVKGFHNLIEYGFLQSLAEGLESLQAISEHENFNLKLLDICEIWSKGSIIESRLVADATKALKKFGSLNEFSGSVYGETLSEMKKLTAIANSKGVKLYSTEAAIIARVESQKHPSQSGKFINALRNIFGGHVK